MNAEKMMAVIKALPKCECRGIGCQNYATSEYVYYEERQLLCDFHAEKCQVPDPNVGDLPYAQELRELFVPVEVVNIHADTPIV